MYLAFPYMWIAMIKNAMQIEKRNNVSRNDTKNICATFHHINPPFQNLNEQIIKYTYLPRLNFPWSLVDLVRF